MNLRKSFLFDDRILSQRERLHKQALMVQAETKQDLSLVILATHQQLAIEPWPDESHADLIRLLASSGHRVRLGFLVPAKPGAPPPNRPAGYVWTHFTGPVWRVCRTTYQKPSWRAPGKPVAAALAD